MVERPPRVRRRRPGEAGGNLRFLFVPVDRDCVMCGEVYLARAANAKYCGRCRKLVDHLKYGSGSGHRESRAQWKPVVDTGRVRCARGADCVFAVDGVAGLIRPGEPWDLGHVDDDPRRYSGPEHRRCNRRTSAHRTRRADQG
jgi:hypothetical protein